MICESISQATEQKRVANDSDNGDLDNEADGGLVSELEMVEEFLMRFIQVGF